MRTSHQAGSCFVPVPRDQVDFAWGLWISVVSTGAGHAGVSPLTVSTQPRGMGSVGEQIWLLAELTGVLSRRLRSLWHAWAFLVPVVRRRVGRWKGSCRSRSGLLAVSAVELWGGPSCRALRRCYATRQSGGLAIGRPNQIAGLPPFQEAGAKARRVSYRSELRDVEEEVVCGRSELEHHR